ncbi:MAG: ATP-binding protein [Acetobacteraceae bacterium]
MRGLRGRLLALVAVALIPAFVIEMTFFIGLRQARQQEVSTDVIRQAELVHATVTSIVEGARQLTFSVAQMDLVQSLDPDCRRMLLAVKTGMPNYRVITVVDAQGQVVCTTWPTPISRNWTTEPYFAEAMRTGEFVVGNFRIGAASGQPVLPLAQPVHNQAGERVGVVIAGLDLTWLGNELAELNRPEYSTIVIGDRLGTVLARYPDHEQSVGKRFLPENMWLVEAKAPGTRTVAGYDGRDRVSGFIPPAVSPVGLLVSVAVYPPSVMAPILRLALWGSVIILVGLLASGALAWTVGERLVRRPLAELARGAGRLAVGDLGARVAIRGGPREFTGLAAAFNDMADRLERRAREREAAERERAAAQAALARINADLEERVTTEVAAREAAQVRLRHSEKVNALGQLAGGVAHDFNNILQSISGALTLLLRRADNADQVRRFGQLALSGAERGASITRRLLMFARRSELSPHVLDPATVIEELRDVLAHTLSSSLELAVDLAPDLPCVFADRAELETALVNLAVNAQDAMPDGGQLRFTARAVATEAGDALPQDLPPGRYVCLSVADTGTGMDAATLARAIEPFYTTKPTGQGTGLGLSMVHGFVTQSGGAMTVASELGKGTTVSLYLPAMVPSASASGAPDAGTQDAGTQAAGTQDIAAPVSRSGAILLVDDDAAVREVLQASLEQAGFTVTSVGSGAEALRLLEHGPRFDVLVSDLAMPGMTGLELIRAVRSQRPNQSAILLTGNAADGAGIAMTTSMPSLTLLRKPISGQALADQIAALLHPGERADLG